MKTYYKAIKDLADDFLQENEEEIKEIIKENFQRSEEEIWDKVYQDWALLDRVWEFVDGEWYSFLRGEWCEDRKTELGSAVKVIEESQEVETDSGLWEGKEPEEAIIAQAFATACNDLYFELEERIKETIKESKTLKEEKLCLMYF